MAMIILSNVIISAFNTFNIAVDIAPHFMVFILPSFIANQPHVYTRPLLIRLFTTLLPPPTVQFHQRRIMKYEMIIIND